MALGHIPANWNDLDRAGSAGFQPARGRKFALEIAIVGREGGTPTGCDTKAQGKRSATLGTRASQEQP